jgi:ElaB/YqjD/DUF883 family membrane-anchored ribosome-binding protein
MEISAMEAAKAKDSIQALKGDAEQMAKDLSELTAAIGSISRESTERLSEEVVKRLEDQLDAITSRISGLRGQVNVGAEKVDAHVKSNPYMYLLGAAGLGFFLGKILPNLKQS